MEPKDLLLRHFEKIVLAGFAGWLVFVLVSFVAMKPPELSSNEQLQDKIAKVDDHMKTFNLKSDPLPDLVSPLKKQLDPATVTAADTFPAWAMHRRPNFAFAVTAGPERVFPKHEAPTDFIVAEKSRGRVKLTWKASPENAYVNIKSYKLLRKEGEAGEFKVVNEAINGEKTEFEDTTVGPRQKYWYRLVETAETQRDHPIIQRDKTDLTADKISLQAEDTKEAVETPPDIYVTMDDGQAANPIAEPPTKGKASLKVWRWHGPSSKFLMKGYMTVNEGEQIGKVEKITTGKTSEQIDFSTGAELVEVRVEKRDVQVGNNTVKKDVAVATIRWPYKGADGKPFEEVIVAKELPEELKKR